jgi:hypothetical protein
MQRPLLVLLILAVAVGLAVSATKLGGRTDRRFGPTDEGCARTQMYSFGSALGMYRHVHDDLPSTLQELTEVDEVTQEPHIDSIPLDPWGHPYEFRRLAREEYRIVSYGPDGQKGTADDITSPEE